MTLPKTRLDDYLVQAGFALDKKAAQAIILSGDVRLKGQAAKAGDIVQSPADLEWTSKQLFVSRSGEKLLGALESFKIQPKDWVCLDIGASTGGFTECLLNAGARTVYAIDVGKGLLDAALRKDPRVHVMEGVNFRHLDPAALAGITFNLAVIDVSFISLAHILPTLKPLLSIDSVVLALVKPQFEGTPKEVPGGFVKDEVRRQEILARVRNFTEIAGFTIQGTMDSTVKGRKGNQETFFSMNKSG